MARLTLPAQTTDEERRLARGAKRAAAIAAGDLAAYRMTGRTIPARKGKGSYRRTTKHGRPLD